MERDPLSGLTTLSVPSSRKGPPTMTPYAVSKEPPKNRPLGLKNTDNKTIAAVNNYTISGAITHWADSQQNGFICGRQGLNNIIDIDARARISDTSATAAQAKLPCPPKEQKETNTPKSPPTNSLPAIILFDFCAAFPSVAHELILIICKAGPPRGAPELPQISLRRQPMHIQRR